MHLKTALCAGAALAALAGPACADDAAIEKRLDQMQRMIEAQQHQIERQNAEIQRLRQSLHTRTAQQTPRARPVEAGQAQGPAPAAAPMAVAAAAPTPAPKKDHGARVYFDHNRPTIATADGDFSLSIRALSQFDTAYYMQSGTARALPPANGPDLSSGANFRRAQLGIGGKLFGDWSYLLNTEFGGSGTESSGHVQALYVEYDGLKPFAFRIGAFPPSFGLEDNTSAASTLFLERAAPSDIIRSAVGGAGRDAASLYYQGQRFYAALAVTGGKVGQSAAFDEQQSIVGRASWLAYSDSDTKFVLSGTGAAMLRGPDSTAAANSPRNLTLSSWPEVTVDSTGTKLISTGARDMHGAQFWGAETAIEWRSLYAQGGYFGYAIEQRAIAPAAPLPDVHFNGWYIQTSWILTGERRPYSTGSAAFGAPRPAQPFSASRGTWGTFELAGRYSDVDLNDRTGTLSLATPYGGVRGGEQKIWTLGLNWYPNSILRFSFDYQNVDIDRHDDAGANVGQTFNVLSFRSQIAL